MKKLKKLCVLVAAVFGSFGVVLCIVGFVLGGGSAAASAIRNSFFGNPFIHIGGGAEQVYEEDYEEAYEAEAEYADDVEADEQGYSDGTMPYKFTAASVKALDIELDYGSLNVYPSEDASIYVQFNGSGQCEVNGGTLELKELSSDEVTVYVPADHIFNSIDIESEIGNVYAEASLKSSGHVEISTDAGEISIMHIEAKSLSVSSDIGRVCIDNSIVSGNTELDADAGTIEYWVEGEPNDYNYIIETDSGSVSVADENLSGFSQKRTIDNGASSQIKAEADAGTISIYFN